VATGAELVPLCMLQIRKPTSAKTITTPPTTRPLRELSPACSGADVRSDRDDADALSMSSSVFLLSVRSRASSIEIKCRFMSLLAQTFRSPRCTAWAGVRRPDSTASRKPGS
jgi:hypothetical protein